MEYQIIKIYNNNVVLAKSGDKQVVLVSKGIGFGRKQGDKIYNHEQIEKVFHEINPENGEFDFNKNDYISKQVKEITVKIVELSKEQIGQLDENITNALCEHIEFALERLRIGLKINNPFIDEIISLYHKEYAIAVEAGKMIKERLDVTIGEEEQGFIALYIYSAKRNRSIRETMKMTRVYKECIDIIQEEFNTKIYLRTTISKEFLKNLRIVLRVAPTDKQIRMAGKDFVPRRFKKSYRAASKIAEYVKAEKGIDLTEDLICFLTIDIEKLIQMS